jgi:Terminase RNaseH-like domain/Terminase large subunit, T4likevirus-type, N-terminal
MTSNLNSIQLPYNFPFEDRPWQRDVIKDPRLNKVLVIHRRAGKTAVALNALIRAAYWPGNESKIFHYVFPQKSQAKEAVWKDPGMLFRYLPEELVEKKNEVELTIFLKNKSQIYLKGADDPDAMRGTNPFGVVFDEYSQMKVEVYNEIYRPILAANGGWSWFIGTPKGKNDFYNKYRFAESHPEKWQTLMLKASESGIIPMQELIAAKEQLPMQAYNQEFECEFIDGAGTVFRRIKENIKAKFKEPERGIEYKIGLDLAKYEDFTVITVVDRSTFEVVFIDRFNQIDYNLQKARIEAIARRYNNAPITIDHNSIGDPISEDLRRTGLTVNDFMFTNESKKALIENLVVMLEQDQLSLPDYPVLIRELEDFSYTLSPKPPYRVIYSAPQGTHDDCVISVALAFWKIGGKMALRNYQPENYGFDMNLRNRKLTQQSGGYSKLIFR